MFKPHSECPRKHIFVFGSNLAGRHGKGAAKLARDLYGAKYGQGVGYQGMSYAIPTKGRSLEVLPVSEIEGYVMSFLDYARENPTLSFYVTAVGTGLAGYEHEDIAPLFKGAPDNCYFDERWEGLV